MSLLIVYTLGSVILYLIGASINMAVMREYYARTGIAAGDEDLVEGDIIMYSMLWPAFVPLAAGFIVVLGTFMLVNILSMLISAFIERIFFHRAL